MRGSKEAERLLLWSALQHGKAMSDLTHEDFLVYEHFLGIVVSEFRSFYLRSPLDRQGAQEAVPSL